MQISRIDTDEKLAALLSEWAGLWQRLSDATPFQSPEWLLSWWRHFGTGKPRILIACRNGALVGVLPLYELAEAGCHKLLPIGIGLSDYTDALIDMAVPDSADRLLAAIVDIPAWDECHIPDLLWGSALSGAPCPPGLREVAIDTVSCPVLPLPPSADTLRSVVPRKTLRDVRRARSRSAAFGDVVIEQADRDTHGAMLDDLFSLHQKRWCSRGEGGVCADPIVQAFHRDAVCALAKAGMLRLYRLSIDDRISAVYYGFSRGNRSYAYLGGFDPELTRLSPGAQILHHAMTEAIAEGAREFHFLRGGEAYKYAWGASDRWSRARTFRRT